MVLLARPGQAPRPKAAPARWLESGRAGQRAPRGKPVTSRSAVGGVWLSQTSVLGPISSIAATPTIQTPANMRAELGRATRCPEAVGAGLRM